MANELKQRVPSSEQLQASRDREEGKNDGSEFIMSRMKAMSRSGMAHDRWGFAQYGPWGFSQAARALDIPEQQPKRTIIIKTTPHCNLSCAYCYAGCHGGVDERDGFRMSKDVLRRLIEGFLEYTAALGEGAEFIWHGGEPLLQGKEFFREIVEIERQCRAAKQEVFNSVQTNGTLLDDEFVQLLKELEFRIGVSLDGPQYVHDRYRRDAHGRSAFDRVMAGVSRLSRHNVRCGVLGTISRASLDNERRILDFYLDHGICNIDFLPCTRFSAKLPAGSPFYVTPAEYASFIASLFDLLIEYDDPQIQVRTVDNIIIGLVGGRPDLCNFRSHQECCHS